MKQVKKAFWAVMLGLICLLAAAVPALAAEDDGVTLALPVSQIFNVSGTAQKPDSTFYYVLTAEDADSPMPQGAEDGRYGFTMTGTQDIALPAMTYSHAGTWRYTLALDMAKDDPCYILDTTVYQIDVYVKNTADGGLAVEAIASFAEDGSKTDSVLFTQTYNADQNAMTIDLRDLTIYTGGNENTGAVDGFPTPRYTGIPENARWRVNGEDWTGDTPSLFERAVAFFTGKAVEANPYPFTVTYTWGDEQEDLSVVDTGRPAEEDTYPGLYVAHITPLEENAEISCSVDDGKTWRKVNTETAILTVRNVLERDRNDQLGVIVSASSTSDEGLNAEQKDMLAKGLGVVVIPNGATLTVNDDPTLGTAPYTEVGLLFDNLLEPYFEGDTVDRFERMRDRTADYLAAKGTEMENRQYLAKYLDLVEFNDGNLWMASSEPCTIYWPYPEGTDQNTVFELQHFSDLFREYGIKGHDRVIAAIDQSTISDVAIENTAYGIRFTVKTNGYGPFMLSWIGSSDTPEPTPQPTPDTPSDTEGGNDKTVMNNVATGIQAHPEAAVLTAVLVVGVLVLIGVKRRRKDQ